MSKTNYSLRLQPSLKAAAERLAVVEGTSLNDCHAPPGTFLTQHCAGHTNGIAPRSPQAATNQACFRRPASARRR